MYTEKDKKRLSGAPPSHEDREAGWTPFRKDYARLLHAPSFRRLQGKTQLFPGHEDDFFRNRLTHSLEVAQIATGIAARVNIKLRELAPNTPPIDLDLVAFAGLAHDLGHPPFGHNGEKALDEKMARFGGFEGNAQTLHILAAVETKKIRLPGQLPSTEFGLDLMIRSLAAVLKYDRQIDLRREPGAKLQKGYYSEEAALVSKIKAGVAPGYQGKFKTVECAIMDLADDIAYSSYDLEDSLHAGFISQAHLLSTLVTDTKVRDSVYGKINDELVKNGYQPLTDHGELFDSAEQAIMPQSGEEGDPGRRLEGIVSQYVRNMDLVESQVARASFTAERVGRLIDGIVFEYEEDHPAMSSVKLQREHLIDVELLKHLNYEIVIRSPRLAVAETRGKSIVSDLFDKYDGAGESLLRGEWKQRYLDAQNSEAQQKRVICDFISGMTDRYAIEMHNALLGDGMSIFKPV